ncbi:hypothetical protein SCLCIDRAFT_1224625 [Scleroderma citrinum Foug A]|uniref:Uncharacterized protein n=1 Tax=Scleroderma citrinum Foug A TaxID=1036808 RepID=A0A0C3CRX0_9AGAM|nr:hypothetical protein SCLCIDRAFT_1224625 [Scleroderma citrinum Foug A]
MFWEQYPLSNGNDLPIPFIHLFHLYLGSCFRENTLPKPRPFEEDKATGIGT